MEDIIVRVIPMPGKIRGATVLELNDRAEMVHRSTKFPLRIPLISSICIVFISGVSGANQHFKCRTEDNIFIQVV